MCGNYCHTQYVVYYHTRSKNIDKCGKNQITTLSVVKITIKFSPCGLATGTNWKINVRYYCYYCMIVREFARCNDYDVQAHIINLWIDRVYNRRDNCQLVILFIFFVFMLLGDCTSGGSLSSSWFLYRVMIIGLFAFGFGFEFEDNETLVICERNFDFLSAFLTFFLYLLVLYYASLYVYKISRGLVVLI